ncbi:MAG: DUF6503 family protein, partial [Xanthomarina sp.]
IINKSIEVSGGKLFDISNIAFDFRDKHYQAKRNHGDFSLERHFKDSIFSVKDVVDTNGFNRFVDNEPLELLDSMATKYASSVNSVHYFSVLPYGLNDDAVIKTFLGEELLKGKNYYKIEITFKEDGGGADYDDVFIYWIQKDTFKNDYLAYSFQEDEGGLGVRFREAYNERYIEGLRFVDYNNFKPKSNETLLKDVGSLYENNELELLSKIELKNITVD